MRPLPTVEDAPTIGASAPLAAQVGIAGACYLAVTLAFLSPILGQLNESLIALPGVALWDQLQELWCPWWLKQSLLAGHNPFFTDLVYSPYGAPLVLHVMNFVPSLLMVLLSSIMTTPLAYNIAVIVAFPLAGVGAYALCRQVTGHHLASLVGGLVFMLSPFIVSKAAAGWMNMLYSGVLPLFAAGLLHATDDDPRRPHQSRLLLAACTPALVGNPVLIVLAANIGVCVFVWRSWSSRAPLVMTRRFLRALWPCLVVLGPYLALTAYYVPAYQSPVSRSSFLPELLSYVLPFTPTSLHAPWVSALNIPTAVRLDLERFDTACYLGILVLPMALAGLVVARRTPVVRFMVVLFVLFAVLSLGPKLLFLREVVDIAGIQVRLPFGLWQKVPILGAMLQSGRYLAMSYMAMSVGVACLVVFASRSGTIRRNLAAAGIALAICVDFGFRLGAEPLPPTPTTSGLGVVLDPRLRSGAPMYYQTLHGRPLVGGYLSRRPKFPLERYRQTPGFPCLYFGDATANCDREVILSSLRSLGVTDVFLDPDDWRGEMLRGFGFRLLYVDRFTAVWAVPASAGGRDAG